MPRLRKPRHVRSRRSQPGLLPDQLARRLATTVALAVTPQCLEKHGIADSAQAGAMGVLPHLVDAPMNLKAVSAVDGHLRHERHPFQAASFVERCEDFRKTSDFDHLAGTQPCPRSDETSDRRPHRTDDPFTRSGGRVGQAALLARVSIQDDHAPDRDEGRVGTQQRQHDCRQHDRKPDRPGGQVIIGRAPAKQDEQTLPSRRARRPGRRSPGSSSSRSYGDEHCAALPCAVTSP